MRAPLSTPRQLIQDCLAAPPGPRRSNVFPTGTAAEIIGVNTIRDKQITKGEGSLRDGVVTVTTRRGRDRLLA